MDEQYVNGLVESIRKCIVFSPGVKKPAHWRAIESFGLSISIAVLLADLKPSNGLPIFSGVDVGINHPLG